MIGPFDLLFASLDEATREVMAESLAYAGRIAALEKAARTLRLCRPVNWNDGEDPEQQAAWTALDEALAAITQATPDIERCGICLIRLEEGELCLTDVDLGTVHKACCGPEREGYVNLGTGEPLRPDEPIPAGWVWSADLYREPVS